MSKTIVNQSLFTNMFGFVGIGAPTGTRTPNLHIRSVLLYPIELWALNQLI